MAVVFLDTSRASELERNSYWIHHPLRILQTDSPSEVLELLREVEGHVQRGFFAAGFVAYEAGYGLLPRMPATERAKLPIAWFALTQKPDRLVPGEVPAGFEPEGTAKIFDLALSRTAEQYRSDIARIREYIAAGETYQVNHTMKFRGRIGGSPRDLFLMLRMEQSVAYAAYFEMDDWAILSLSPELFFRTTGDQILMRPMKGTASRGRTLQEDEGQKRLLIESEKERSENLMIVDLLRNDLGKICVRGSVAVTNPLMIETYESVLQMTSSISGLLLPGTRIADIFKAAFPSGSVTGAPKIRTMQIIHALEQSPRSIYTGAIGFVSQNEAAFNVAIRTIVVDRNKGSIEMGVGSGILYEADPANEYEECRLKARFLTHPSEEFQLFETILWTPQNGYFLLDLHLDRLIDSAKYFLFSVSRSVVEAHLELRQSHFRGVGTPQRVRLFVDRNGRVDIHSGPLEEMPPERPKIRFATKRTNSADRFLYHKTTNRSLYVEELELARKDGFFDVIFCNEENEITEGAIANVFIKKHDQYLTPPVECGLLAGTYRRYLVESAELPVKTQVLRKSDLIEANSVYLANAVRGLFEVTLVV